MNLLNNAFDAISKQSQKWIKIEVLDLGSVVKILVTDSSGGIAPEIGKKSMNPFFTTKGVGHGTGLGLSISKGIVEAHKGRLYLDTAAADTQFVMEIPKSHQADKAVA
ncbi:MAG: GHKL domain-containing protein [Chitinophagaceae bacterium]|nr:GHKL domain-containing protein [Oligoflexus sp.]